MYLAGVLTTLPERVVLTDGSKFCGLFSVGRSNSVVVSCVAGFSSGIEAESDKSMRSLGRCT